MHCILRARQFVRLPKQAAWHVSVATIKADITHIMRVLGAAGRVELAVLAVQCGLVGLDSISSAAGDSPQRDRQSDGVGQLA